MSLARTFQRFRNRNKKIPPTRNKVYFEALEPRLLLSSDLAYTAAAGTAADLTLRLQKVDNIDTLQLINNVDQSIVESQALYDTSAVVITGADQDDTLRLDLDFDDLLDSILINFHGGLGDDTLVGPDTDNLWEITGAGEGKLNSQMSFTDVENLSGGREADTFDFDDGASIAGLLNGGRLGVCSDLPCRGSHAN